MRPWLRALQRSFAPPFLVALSILIYPFAASPAAGGEPSPLIRGPLRTSGNRIVDSAGEAVTFRGVAVEWLSWQPHIRKGTPLDDESVGAMRRWGVNVVRVALGQQFWNLGECQHRDSYPTSVDRAVESITSRGMVALLDLHEVTGFPCLPAGQRRMADATGSIRFWQSVASRYKGNPLVAFDLYNEPHNISWDQWLNGGTLPDDPTLLWAAGMQQLYDAVRAAGAENLVFVSGNNWGASPPDAGHLLRGRNIVYAVHSYTCPTAPPPACKTGDADTPAPPHRRLDAWTTLAASVPVAVSEFGWPDGNSGAYTQRVIDWAEAHRVGWIAYSWSPNHETNNKFGFLADLDTFAPAPSGIPVRNGVARNLEPAR